MLVPSFSLNVLKGASNLGCFRRNGVRRHQKLPSLRNARIENAQGSLQELQYSLIELIAFHMVAAPNGLISSLANLRDFAVTQLLCSMHK
jgi:hypothetical protein